MNKRHFFLAHKEARKRAAAYCMEAPEGWMVTFQEPSRTIEQNAKFHAICADLARSELTWGGKRRSAEQWKVLLVSGHAKATKQEVEIAQGIEGEFVSLRESTSSMSKKRGSSLIEYSLAFSAQHLNED